MSSSNYTFFFYGTLLDDTVLKGVTGDCYWVMRKQPAILKDFKRCKVKGAKYPAIINSIGYQVEGIVVDKISPKALERLDDFEDDEYERRTVIVDLIEGEKIKASAYVAGPKMLLEDEEWHLNDWKRSHRAKFLKKLENGLKVY